MTTALNTTDYAVLGLLERKPWSAYELTQYMRMSSIRAVWPRAESRLYESPKKLQKLGLASSVNEGKGKKPRTVYSITESGVTALKQWLLLPGKTLTIEYEAMLKLVFGDINLLAQQTEMLKVIEGQVSNSCMEIQAVFEEISTQHSIQASPSRYAQNLLINSYIKEVVFAQKKWLEFAKQFQSQWDEIDNEDSEVALALIKQQYKKMLAG